MSRLEPQPIAVTVIGGFLGAGKTTLLNHLMSALEGVPTAVLVNDFGSINVDAKAIARVDADGVIELSNGCICCTIRNDVTSTLMALLERDARPRHVLIETSGVSDPRAVAQSMLELQRLGGLRLDGLLSVVDAEGFDPEGPYGKLSRGQIVASDVVILNKTDLVDEPRRREVEQQIRSIAKEARIVSAENAEVPPELLLAVETDTARLEGVPVISPHVHAADQRHTHGFATHTLRREAPFQWSDLAPRLAALDPRILRVKGVLSLKERPYDRILLHVVGRRIYVRTVEPWGEVEPHSELVLIGEAGFDPAAIEDALMPP